MVKRKVVDAETGKEVEEASQEEPLVPEPVVKKFESTGRVRPLPVKSKTVPSKKVVPEPPEPAKPAVEAPSPAGDQIELICLRPSRRNEVGRVTKNEYVFEGGEPVLVDVRDAEYLKAARRGSRTCGDGETRIFVESDEI